MAEFIAKNMVAIGILVILLFISLLSLPSIFIAGKGQILFSGFFNMRALLFSLGNALLITVVLVIGSVVIGAGIADESAGSGMMMLIKWSVGIGLIYGFLFPYSIIYLIHNNVSK